MIQHMRTILFELDKWLAKTFLKDIQKATDVS